ncbi:hypothetical protein FAZ69_23455 [Trinickia terrae]|uniref:Uncharacterized protein n=1 Tax=Trinickia terrae TaxID=2571161 RepID=A0A4U1HPX1_9BURK|nr:hypothetical protein [Trinickia terrae]TKC83449.1 hypothetical protein FAZ69_23455 [Trinickia terrae]
MKEFVLLTAAIAVWVLVWTVLAKYWKRKGHGALLAHMSAGVSGFVVCSILFIAELSGKSAPGDGKSSVDASAPKAAVVQAAQKNESGSNVPQAGAKVEPDMPVAFTGAASEGAVTAENWPKSVTIVLPVSEDEKRYMADYVCLDESECYGPKRFQRYIFKRYPGLARVQYHPLLEDASDSELVSNRKENFFQSLYFSKQIQLANGQSLYDFMRSCSRGFTALDAAEVGYDEKMKAPYFDLQYFPTLRRADTGEPIELQILFERRGDKLIARSPFFTSNALRYSDFLRRHNVTCWNKGTMAE